MTHKILEEHLQEGVLKQGSAIGFRIDQCLTQDSTGTMAWLEFESLGLEQVEAELVVSYCDHTSLGFKGESTNDHLFLQTIASHYGARFSKNGNGVCHVVHYERFGIPGKTLLGSDSHTPTAGGIGMLGIGAGGMDVAVAMGGGSFFLNMPKMMDVRLDGKLPWGVTAKDVSLELLRRLSSSGGTGFFLEFTGPGVKSLSIPERVTITNMAAELGATSAIFPSDEMTAAFFRLQGREGDWVELHADIAAEYDTVLEIDLSTLKPLVAMPEAPDNVFYIDDVVGTPINQVYIGSCTNGHYRDIKIVAEMLKDKHVCPDIDVIISPGSRQAWQMLIEDGSFLSLSKAGVRLIEPGCNACIGLGFVPGDGHLSLRTLNRNWKGRGGNKLAKTALCSAEIAAASALAGKIADPRALSPVSVEIDQVMVDDTMILEPSGKQTEIIRSTNIVPLQAQCPLSEKLEGEVLIKLGDGISTDAIIIAGPLIQHLRSNLPETAKFTFHYEDKEFAQRAMDKGGGFIVAGENYGQGSSREHAALTPWYLGVKAVFAKSYARIHRSNLINVGIIPFVCDTENLSIGDKLEIDVSQFNDDLLLLNLTHNTKIKIHHHLTSRESEIIQAGGLLAHTLHHP